MATPVQISNLPPASVANDADETLLRQGLTDFRCTIAKIRNLNLPGLSSLPGGSAVASDLLLIARSGSNYQIRFEQVGFLKGCRAWFYLLTAPAGWEIVANTGDRLLAVSDGVNQYSATASGSQGGTWQQQDHALTLSELPAHAHDYRISINSTDDDRPGLLSRSAKTPASTNRAQTDLSGGGLGHNHGNLWRPLANIGIICEKTA